MWNANLVKVSMLNQNYLTGRKVVMHNEYHHTQATVLHVHIHDRKSYNDFAYEGWCPMVKESSRTQSISSKVRNFSLSGKEKIFMAHYEFYGK